MPGREINASHLRDVDALWVRSVTRVDRELLSDTSLAFVGTATAGTEHVDTAFLESLGIGFASAPGANANSVLEYVVAALIELQEPWECLESGGTLGIVGYGEVGRRLTDFAKTMGWNVRVYDPWLSAKVRESAGVVATGESIVTPSFDQLLRSDVISLHCALHARSPWPSRHLIDSRALQALSGRQWLVNAARGAAVDNAALKAHLSGSAPVNCVFDVWEGEPQFMPELLESDAMKFGTPHIAGYSYDAKCKGASVLYEAMRACGLVNAELREGLEVPVDLQSCGAGFAGLRGLIRQRYDIRVDDARLRDIAALPEGMRGAAFDHLRRSYRKRRELRGSRLVLAGGLKDGANSVPAQRYLDALGIVDQGLFRKRI